jgi:SAM-dependent methyltransferase
MRVLGRGDGVSIRAVDFRRAFTDEVQARYRFEFTPGHWIEFLRGHAAAFDAAFSNHCMEHIYNDPTEVLRAVRGALRPGGAYVFAMPIEMSRSNPFARAYPVLLRGPLYGWMMDAVDCGHPWKADLPELAWRLRDAGFERVEFFLREGGLPYLDAPLLPPFVRADDADWSGAPARSDGQPAAAPLARRIVEEGYRWLYRVKGVLGVNQIKNRRTHEVLVRAWAGPAPRGGA